VSTLFACARERESDRGYFQNAERECKLAHFYAQLVNINPTKKKIKKISACKKVYLQFYTSG